MRIGGPHSRRLQLVLVLVLQPLLLCLAEDPFPKMLAGEKLTRPSSVLMFEDVPLDPDPSIKLPCLAARLCECKAEGGWNHTFWLNTASAVFQGQVYVVILNRKTLYRPTVTYQQTKQTRRNQVMEANALYFCKADLLSGNATVHDCKLVEPQPEYRERHPFPTHQHFNMLGLIDPRLASAGDEHGLFLQVGCRPKELSDHHETTKFREMPCLIKLLEGSKQGGDGSQQQQQQRAVLEAGATGGPQLRRELSSSRRVMSVADVRAAAAALQRQPQLPRGQRHAACQSSQMQASQRLTMAAAASVHWLWRAVSKRWLLDDTSVPSTQMRAPEPAQQQGQQQGKGGSSSPGTSTQAVDTDTLAQLFSKGMADVAKDWPVGHLTKVKYGEQNAYEKNWVAFEYKGRLLWSRHLSPQEVVTVHANGSATTLFTNKNEHVFKPLATMCGKGPRGNTPAVRVPKEMSGLPRDYYLGILHWTPQRGGVDADTLERQCHEYINFFFLMEAEPPFNIVEVARPPVPLLAATNPVYEAWPLRFGMGYISFPTGLVIAEDKVVITYGVGDRKVRVWRAALKDVLLTFSSEIATLVPVPPVEAPPPPPMR